MEHTLKVNDAELAVIAEGLSMLPFGKVLELYNKLTKQISVQEVVKDKSTVSKK